VLSRDHPTAIMKAGGLLASLQYLDFFGLHVQRTALNVVANSCRGLGSFALRRDTSLSVGMLLHPSFS
jgi:hypothetical protein